MKIRIILKSAVLSSLAVFWLCIPSALVGCWDVEVIKHQTDTIPPTVTLHGVVSPTDSTHQLITGEVSEQGVIISITVPSAGIQRAQADIYGLSWSYNLTGMVTGDNRILIDSKDNAGNSGSTVAATIIVRDPADTSSALP
jgi:hypothetical protein